jgi:fumarate reductase subunit D
MIMIYCLLHRLSSAIYDHNLLFVTSTVVCYIWSWFIVCDINCRLLYMITILLLVTSPVIMIYCLGHRLSSWYIVCDIGCRLLYMIMIYCLWHRLSSAMYDHDLHSTSFLINLFGMEFLLFCQYLLKYWRF